MANQHTDFWRMVDKSGDCWLWTGYINAKGYGTTTYQGVGMNAHRAAWLRSGRTIPAGLQLDHLCRNRACVRPDHMEPVTNRENHQRARSLACPKGHHYTPENTRNSPDGKRHCRECSRGRVRAYRAQYRRAAGS